MGLRVAAASSPDSSLDGVLTGRGEVDGAGGGVDAESAPSSTGEASGFELLLGSGSEDDGKGGLRVSRAPSLARVPKRLKLRGGADPEPLCIESASVAGGGREGLGADCGSGGAGSAPLSVFVDSALYSSKGG